MTWITSTGHWPNSSRLVSEAARLRRPRPPSANSRNEPGPAARTGLGVLARSTALLSDGPAAEPLYREAIERLERDGIVIHLARAHLLYGEWLRRVNRRHDGREHLRHAYQTFSDIGAAAFAERARGELQLFLSSRTVEYHLHKVFAKLGVSSRRELPVALRKLDGAMSRP
jgi:hypothetical protein